MKTAILIFALLFIVPFIVPTVLYAATKPKHEVHSTAIPVCALDGLTKDIKRKGFFHRKMGKVVSKHDHVKHRLKRNQEIPKNKLKKWALITFIAGLGCLAIGLVFSLTYVLMASYLLLVMALAFKRKSRDHIDVEKEKKSVKESAKTVLIVLLAYILIAILAVFLTAALITALINAFL